MSDLLRLVMRNRRVLFVDPTATLDGIPVRRSEVLAFVVKDVIVHQSMQLGEVEKWNHGIAVVLCVEVGFPKEQANDEGGLASPRVPKHVWILGHFAVGVLKVANIVHGRISNNDRNDPPKEEQLSSHGCLSNGSKHDSITEELEDRKHLELLHNTTLLTVRLGLHAPSHATVVNRLPPSRIDEATQSASKREGHVYERLEELVSTRGDVSKHGILKFFTRIVACQLRVLVNIVGVGVVLFVHDAFVRAKLKAHGADNEENDVVDPLGLKGIAMKEFVLTGKSEALELKAIKDVERKKHSNLSRVLEDVLGEREDLQAVDGVRRGSENRKVGEEPLEAFVVRLLNQLENDTVVKDPITFLSLGVLDVGPVFALELAQAIGITLTIEDLVQGIVVHLVDGYRKRREAFGNVWSHFEDRNELVHQFSKCPKARK